MLITVIIVFVLPRGHAEGGTGKRLRVFRELGESGKNRKELRGETFRRSGRYQYHRHERHEGAVQRREMQVVNTHETGYPISIRS